MSEPARIVTCPTCRARLRWSTANPHRPFCSERCKLIDLGEWASERHRIAGDAVTDEGDGASREDDPGR